MSRSRFTQAFDLHNMVPGPAGVATSQVIYKSEDGILLAYGITVPGAVANYAQGCIFFHTDGSAGGTIYVNEGDDTTADFNAVGAEDSLAALLLTGTSLAVALQSQTKGVEAAYPHSGTAGIGPSALLWDGAPIEEIQANPGLGFYYFNDFMDPDTYAAAALNGGLLLTQNTAEGTLANDPAVPGGILKASCAGVTAAKGPCVQLPGVECEPLTGTTIYIEWRIQLDTDDGRIFMGLADDSQTAIVADDTIIVNKDYAGFFRDAGTSTTKKYSIGSANSGGTGDATDNATAAMTKTEYNTFGMKITGIGDVAGSTIEFYCNGTLVATRTEHDDMPLALMCPTFVFCGDGGADTPVASLDWIQVLVHHASGTCREA